MPKKKETDVDTVNVVDLPVVTDAPVMTDVPIVPDEPKVVQILPGCRAVSLWESRRPA